MCSDPQGTKYAWRKEPPPPSHTPPRPGSPPPPNSPPSPSPTLQTPTTASQHTPSIKIDASPLSYSVHVLSSSWDQIGVEKRASPSSLYTPKGKPTTPPHAASTPPPRQEIHHTTDPRGVHGRVGEVKRHTTHLDSSGPRIWAPSKATTRSTTTLIAPHFNLPAA